MKTNLINKLCVGVFAIISLSGCATWSTASVSSAVGTKKILKTTKVKIPEQIIITEGDMLNRKYTVLADISATVNKTTVFHSTPTEEQVNEKLKKKAAEIGADAVIMVRYGNPGVSAFSWGSLNGKGRAISFND